ncbi:MAG TPA: hypothetical protein VLK26_05270 [Rudaea sp.]|nr:hypothetical protein [Rudaea sp.]
MAKKSHLSVADLRGYSAIAVDATIGLTSLVETMHHNILRTPGILGAPAQGPTSGITGFVYKSIRGVTRAVGSGIDAALARLVPMFGSGATSTEREAVLAALNGVLGDHLQRRANPLAIPMQFRLDGRALELTSTALNTAMPHATGKVLLLVHGLCMNDLQWRRKGHDHGASLCADAHFTPVRLRYNSGLHVSENGRALADEIETLLRAWPVPVDELVILAHSMGGLVTRSACHYAALAQREWLKHLCKIVFLGTPHHGAPLERGGNWIDTVLDASPYTSAFSRLGKIRSAGITDLRHGNMVDEDWAHEDRFARSRRKPCTVQLPADVQCYTVAASLAKKTERAKSLLGDGLVPLASALGQHKDPQRSLPFAKSRQWIGYGMNHLDLLDHAEVYARIRSWV